MVSPGSALISLRKIVSPAPVVGLYRSASTCCWTEELAFMTVAAWPKASEAPNPRIAASRSGISRAEPPFGAGRRSSGAAVQSRRAWRSARESR
jgi:hypothetical protein